MSNPSEIERQMQSSAFYGLLSDLTFTLTSFCLHKTLDEREAKFVDKLQTLIESEYANG